MPNFRHESKVTHRRIYFPPLRERAPEALCKLCHTLHMHKQSFKRGLQWAPAHVGASLWQVVDKRLYRRSYDGIHLLWVTAKEAWKIIEEIHESSYEPHMNVHMLSRKIMRQGYYWTTMEAGCVAHVRKCHQCQVHGDLKHIPPMPLHTMTSP